MKTKIVQWLELDKLALESPRRMLVKLFKMLPLILGSVFLYIMLTKIGEGYGPHSTIGQLTGIVPLLSYCIWFMMVFIIVLKPINRG